MPTQDTNGQQKLRGARLSSNRRAPVSFNKSVRRALRWAIPPAMAAVTMGAMLALGAGPAGAATTPSEPLGQQIASHAQPAVDLVTNEVTAQVSFYEPRLNATALVQWAQNDPDVQTALQSSDDTQAAQLILAELAKNPNLYLANGTADSAKLDLEDQGSGFTVTSNGYLLTNAHVVDDSTATIATEYFEGLTSDQLQTLVNDFAGQLNFTDGQGNQIPFTSDQQEVENIVFSFIGSTWTASDLQQSVDVYQGAQPVQQNPLPAQVVAAGKVYPGNDVAILKVDASGLPTLPLATTAVNPGDQVWAVGYPGDATFDPSSISTTRFDSTVTQGDVSNLLNSSGGNFQWIENNATINHGSSGGPLLNASGQVIGITTATDDSLATEGSNNGGTLFYALPISVAQQLMSQNNVSAASNPDQATYNAGVDAIAASNKSRAVADLHRVQGDGYNTPYLQPAIVQASNLKGTASSAMGTTTLISIGAGAIVVVAGLIGMVLVLRRRRRAARPLPGAVAYPPMPATPVPTAAHPVESAPVAVTPSVPEPPASQLVPAATAASLATMDRCDATASEDFAGNGASPNAS